MLPVGLEDSKKKGRSEKRSYEVHFSLFLLLKKELQNKHGLQLGHSTNNNNNKT